MKIDAKICTRICCRNKSFQCCFCVDGEYNKKLFTYKGEALRRIFQSSVIAVPVKCVQVKQLHWRHGSPRMSHSDGIDNHEHMFAGSHSRVVSFFRCPTRDNKVFPQHMSAAMQFNKIVYRSCNMFILFIQPEMERKAINFYLSSNDRNFIHYDSSKSKLSIISMRSTSKECLADRHEQYHKTIRKYSRSDKLSA